MTIWVLTSEYNDYDQHGAYFEQAWDHKPDREELVDQLKDTDYRGWVPSYALVTHILEGGGRQGNEDTWYNLEKVR